jgi:hypothetical protein
VFAVLWCVPAILFAAAAYELTLLVDLWGSYDGSARDAFVDFGETVATVAYLTMLVASVGAFVNALNPRPTWAVALFAPAGAAFVATRFYMYDPYYLPSLRRFSDDGSGETTWILGLLAAALVLCFLTRLMPRVGSIATAPFLFVLVMASLLASAGH